MRIGQLANQTGLDRQTIRYYEKIGLLNRPERTESNYRVYDNSEIRRLNFICRAKNLGFSLNDIKILLDMADGRIKDCNQVRSFAESRLLKVRNRIGHLREIEKTLSWLVKECRRKNSLEKCPILDSLRQNKGESE